MPLGRVSDCSVMLPSIQHYINRQYLTYYCTTILIKTTTVYRQLVPLDIEGAKLPLYKAVWHLLTPKGRCILKNYFLCGYETDQRMKKPAGQEDILLESSCYYPYKTDVFIFIYIHLAAWIVQAIVNYNDLIL